MKIERHETGPRMSKAEDFARPQCSSRRHRCRQPERQKRGRVYETSCRNIDGFLAMAGTLWPNIWITDMAHFAEMRRPDAGVSPSNTPATRRYF